MPRAPYIVFEGIDASGKDTQADMLCDWFRSQGLNPLRLNQPNETTPAGVFFRKMLREGLWPNAQAAMGIVDHMVTITEQITPARDEGRPVLVSRSFLSALAYQQDYWPLDYLLTLYEGLPEKPSGLILIDIPVKVAQQRVVARKGQKEFYENPEIFQRVRERYLGLMDLPRVKALVGGNPSFMATLDGTRTRESIHEDIRGLAHE